MDVPRTARAGDTAAFLGQVPCGSAAGLSSAEPRFSKPVPPRWASGDGPTSFLMKRAQRRTNESRRRKSKYVFDAGHR